MHIHIEESTAWLISIPSYIEIKPLPLFANTQYHHAMSTCTVHDKD